jgi:hypothetical protein
VLGLVAAGLRRPRRSWQTRFAALTIPLAIAAAPALILVSITALARPQSLAYLANYTTTAMHGGSLLKEASYIWQLYLPRMPGMTDYFPGVLTTRQLWFDGWVGFYGWADTVFPPWVSNLALAFAAPIVGLLLVGLLSSRVALGKRKMELLVYLVMVLGLATVVGTSSYTTDVIHQEGPFWEPRYFLPLLPLLGAGLALAARGAGRRWGPAVGALIVVLILAHDIFSHLLLVPRYYG